MSKTNKYNIEDVGDHFMDLAVKKVKERETFVYVLDNTHWKRKVHDMRSDAQNKSVHAVATSLAFDRIPSTDLPDDGLNRDLNDKQEIKRNITIYATCCNDLVPVFSSIQISTGFSTCSPVT